MVAGDAAAGRKRRWRLIALGAALIVAIAAGLGIGYAVWSKPDYYAVTDPAKLPAGEANDLVRYGWTIINHTAAVIGKSAADPAMRYAGNNLACADCHINAGLQPFAAPFVSTYTSYPLMADDRVVTLTDRINGCMRRSMNGKPLPPDGREMQAMIAYLRYVGKASPEGVRVAGMGLMPLAPAAQAPDAGRGKAAYAEHCAKCHGANGEGNAAAPPATGWAVPPLWGDASFNNAAGMSHIETAAAFVRANMPEGVTWQEPILTAQQAWDLAAYVTTQPRPAGPPRP